MQKCFFSSWLQNVWSWDTKLGENKWVMDHKLLRARCSHLVLWGCWSHRAHWNQEVTSSWRSVGLLWCCCCCCGYYLYTRTQTQSEDASWRWVKHYPSSAAGIQSIPHRNHKIKAPYAVYFLSISKALWLPVCVYITVVMKQNQMWCPEASELTTA